MQSVVALGNFDGVHIGHAAVIDCTVKLAAKLQCTPLVYSFSTHPQHFFGRSLPLLTTTEEKQKEICRLGIQTQIYDDFALVCALSAEDFVRQILVKKLSAKAVVTGPDYFFGKGKEGNVDLLKEFGKKYGFSVYTVPFATIGGEKVSSSALRRHIAAGEMEETAQKLGRPYEMEGAVVSGKGLARKWGTPTVNVTLPPEKAVPRFGVYAVELVTDTVWQGVCNVGVRPSFDDGNTPNMEVHVLNGAPIVGERATVRFLQFLRPEKKFLTQALISQIQADCERAQQFFEERSAAK